MLCEKGDKILFIGDSISDFDRAMSKYLKAGRGDGE